MRIVKAIALILVLGFSSGCSVSRALSGEDRADFEAQQSATGGEVEFLPGHPAKVLALANAAILDRYGLDAANDPGPDEAAEQTPIDAVPLGVWEIVNTPIEGFQGDRLQVSMTRLIEW
jgi:hypothetical protein